MQDDKLLLIHEYLDKISSVTTKEEFDRLTREYKAKVKPSESDESVRALWQKCTGIGRQMVRLKGGGEDYSRSRRLEAMSEEERAEFSEAERVVDENFFFYHFQPIVSSQDGEIYSYEALMRPISGMGTTPKQILKYAQLTERLDEIERQTFMNILSTIDSQKTQFRGRRVFINSIPDTKITGDDLSAVSELLMKHSDTAVVELIEKADPEEGELNAIKERYRNMGVKLAIDNYGAAYSNVKNLTRYMPDYVKIDRALLSEIQLSPKKRRFVREIIEFCHDNGIMALAEGIETSEELRTVILLGVDLIQGYYSGKPAAEIIDSISDEIRDEIRRFQKERQEGRDHKEYRADKDERISLSRLTREDIRTVIIGGSGDVVLVGSGTLDTRIHLEVEEGFSGSITLDCARLSNDKGQPCIDLGDGCEVTLFLTGDNRMEMGGIRVPQSSRLSVRGSGRLVIKLDSPEYYGIGNGAGSTHGELLFDQSGSITIDAHGQTGVGIGAWDGGKISIVQGQYALNLSGDLGVGIGALFKDSVMELHDCGISSDISLSRGTAVGSLCADCDVHLYKTSARLYLAGTELVGVGSVAGSSAKVKINDSSVIVNMRGVRCSAAAALEGESFVHIERTGFRITSGGEKALAFGGYTEDNLTELINADTSVKLETDLDTGEYYSPGKVKIVGGRSRFLVNGVERERL